MFLAGLDWPDQARRGTCRAEWPFGVQGVPWGVWVRMAARPHIYSGQGFSLQRDKNRFVLPAQFRGTLKESSGRAVLCLAKHDRWKCLTGFGLSRVDEFEEMIRLEQSYAVQSGKEFDKDKRSMDLYGFHEVPFDGSGRFVLPDALVTTANIGNQLYFHGAGSFFTAWNPDELSTMGDGWESAQAMCASLSAKELAKAGKK